MNERLKKRLMMGLMVSQIGFVIIVCGLLGSWADSYFNTRPFLAFTGLIIGFGSAISLLVRINQMQKKDRK